MCGYENVDRNHKTARGNTTVILFLRRDARSKQCWSSSERALLGPIGSLGSVSNPPNPPNTHLNPPLCVGNDRYRGLTVSYSDSWAAESRVRWAETRNWKKFWITNSNWNNARRARWSRKGKIFWSKIFSIFFRMVFKWNFNYFLGICYSSRAKKIYNDGGRRNVFINENVRFL